LFTKSQDAMNCQKPFLGCQLYEEAFSREFLKEGELSVRDYATPNPCVKNVTRFQLFSMVVRKGLEKEVSLEFSFNF
jgi:hypothetical protein